MTLFAIADWAQVLGALIVFLITGIAQYLQKRAREKSILSHPPETEVPPVPEHHAPPELRPRPAPPRQDWEEQLRRFLEGVPENSPPPVALPPALPAPPPQRPQTALRAAPTVRETSDSTAAKPEDEISEGGGSRPGVQWTSNVRLNTASKLAAAKEAYRKASNLSQFALARMRKAQARTETHDFRRAPRPKSPATKTSREAVNFRHPRSLRQAIIAQAVLQPPKSLE